MFVFSVGFLMTEIMHAQTDTTLLDSTRSGTLFDNSIAEVEYFIGGNIDQFKKIDTSLNNFHKFNPARNQLFDFAYLGNLGAPYYSRWFLFERSLGFDYGRHERDLYLLDIDELKYYRNNVPFTDLYYVAGTNAEQLFRVTHARNFGKDFNISIHFEKIASEGFYQHMRNDYNNLSLTSWYKTPKGKYAVYAGGIRSKNKNEENGGINNDDLFNFPTPNLAEPYRDDAMTDWNNFQGQITQQYHFGKTIEYAINDSTSGNYYAPAITLSHTFGAHNYYYKFQDASFDQSFYGEIFVDADTLRDIADVDGFYNRVALSNVKYKTISADSVVQKLFNWEIFALQQYHELSDQSGELKYNNSIAGISLSGKYLFDTLLNISLKGAYDLENNAYESSLQIKILRTALRPFIELTHGIYSPMVIQEHYYGFNFRWDNELQKNNYSKAALTLQHKPSGFKLMGSYEIIINYIASYPGFFSYMNYQNRDLTIFKVLLEKNFELGNFHLDNRVGFQTFPNGEINLPKYLANISWYYQNKIFKNALFFQTGINAWYIQDHIGPRYEFITGTWIYETYQQNPLNSAFQPVIDVFASFDIQTLRFFVKVDNVAEGLFAKGYYEAPLYPMQPRGVKFGVNWFLFY